MISVNNGLPEIAEQDDLVALTEDIGTGTNGTADIGTLEQ